MAEGGQGLAPVAAFRKNVQMGRDHKMRGVALVDGEVDRNRLAEPVGKWPEPGPGLRRPNQPLAGHKGVDRAIRRRFDQRNDLTLERQRLPVAAGILAQVKTAPGCGITLVRRSSPGRQRDDALRRTPAIAQVLPLSRLTWSPPKSP